MDTKEHNQNIVDQFSKQAIPFTKLPGHLDAIQMLIEMAGLTNADNVLDIACGPGLVLCEFAKTAKEAVGIDITEQMLTQAKIRQDSLDLNNITWTLGDVTNLPFEADSFSLVITRYSFHHFLDPEKVLSEMYRVCKPSGRILIADLALPADKINAFNAMEKLRDSSHTKALTFEQFDDLLQKFNLKNLKTTNYEVHIELEKQLKASFPVEGDEEKIRQLFARDIRTNELGVNSCIVDGEIHYSYPISIFVGEK